MRAELSELGEVKDTDCEAKNDFLKCSLCGSSLYRNLSPAGVGGEPQASVRPRVGSTMGSSKTWEENS